MLSRNRNRWMLGLTGLLTAASAAAPAARADIVNFTYTSTTNNAHNNRAYFLNTGLSVQPGDRIRIQGTGSIYVGGGYYVLSNFDMGLVSALNQPSLVRDYHGNGTNYTGTPYPLAGESVLFSQDRISLTDDHHLNIIVTAQSAGKVYIGMFDNYFADNTGSHHFTLEVIPEPATASLALFAVLGCLARRRTTIPR